MPSLSKYITHTDVKPTTTAPDISRLCQEAIEHSFVAVCVPPNFVQLAKLYLRKESIKVATTIGFPFGYCCLASKIAEIHNVLEEGVDEIDVVANISAIKSSDWDILKTELEAIIEIIRKNEGVALKIIIESGVLTDNEIIACCKLYGDSGTHFLKTSTGYAEKGASLHAVKLMRANLPPHVQINASGGIRSHEKAMQMIAAGASRIGCSTSVMIVRNASVLEQTASSSVISSSNGILKNSVGTVSCDDITPRCPSAYDRYHGGGNRSEAGLKLSTPIGVFNPFTVTALTLTSLCALQNLLFPTWPKKI